MKQTILDPSDSSWNDNYQKFRLGVNETENLVENVLNDAFETVTSVKEGVEILDVFHQYTPRCLPTPSKSQPHFNMVASCIPQSRAPTAYLSIYLD